MKVKYTTEKFIRVKILSFFTNRNYYREIDLLNEKKFKKLNHRWADIKMLRRESYENKCKHKE